MYELLIVLLVGLPNNDVQSVLVVLDGRVKS